MNKSFRSRQITLFGLLTAILLILSYTPLGYLNLGPLGATLNMIPVAVAAAALGPKGGALIGAVFGMTSFFQCLGIGGTSQMGVILFEISPFLTFVQRLLPRILTGFLVGVLYRGLKKTPCKGVAAAAAGFSAAFLNTFLFMGALVLLFGRTEYVQGLIAGRNIIVFLCAFVGVQAVLEMAISTVITAALLKGLEKARLLER